MESGRDSTMGWTQDAAMQWETCAEALNGLDLVRNCKNLSCMISKDELPSNLTSPADSACRLELLGSEGNGNSGRSGGGGWGDFGEKRGAHV